MVNMTFEEAWALVKDNKCIEACCVAFSIASGVAVVPAIVTGPLLPALGFAASGIVKGSLAAAWHSAIGSAVSPSLFATIQSAGAFGYGAPVVASAVTTAASGAAVVIIIACAKACGATDIVKTIVGQCAAKP